MSPERIVIVGNGGSGKSHLAARLAARLSLKHVEIDALAFEGEFRHVHFPLLHARLDNALSEGRWVIEGMHRLEIRERALPRADLVVWLDVSRGAIAARLLRRLFLGIMKGDTRLGLPYRMGSLGRELKWLAKTLRSHARRRGHATAILEAARQLEVPSVTLTSKEVDGWLESLR